ncbi:acyl-ACP desaturase, partial [Mycobacteroides abscessus subsp. abscessus]|nr:acyl-ACP desaturase [Mycobacteroides abscessus subsp. abscessus]
MPRELTDIEMLSELEPIAETNLNRHLAVATEWHPHDYVPWDRGRNFAQMGGDDWDPEQSQLSEVARAAMITNLLTEDNLPSYHRQAAKYFGLDGAWGTWVGRWTAEENRHGIVIRDYLVVTRGVDPVALERARMEHMTAGFDATDEEESVHQTDFLLSVAYTTLQEL